jgi:hypothetical protein
LVDESHDVVFAGDVTAHKPSDASHRDDLPDRFLASWLVNVRDDDLGPDVGRGRGRGTANSGTIARDEGNPACGGEG